jgi:5-methylcytosine-specific restriction endonuclease McrA
VEATEADHIVPHRGDVKLFMHGDLQSLCHRCHSKKTMTENTEIFYGVSGKNA